MAAREDALRQALTALARSGAAPVSVPSAGQRGWRGWRTGIEALDAVLPAGVPRGRLVEWAGSRTSGKSAALAGLVRTVLEAGEGAGLGVSYVGAAETLDPRSWSWTAAGTAPFWVVRVPSARELGPALDVVLRMGAFGLVVSEGVPPPRAAFRLERLARGSDAAWVAVVERAGSVPGAAVRLRFAVESRDASSCRVGVRISRKGWARRAEFTCGIVLPDRLCDHSGLPDRRTRAGHGGR